MMIWLKAHAITLGLWLARWGGWRPCALPHLPFDDQVALVRDITRDIDQRFPTSPGAFKRREALRVLLNLRPGAAERDLNLLIELSLQ